MNRPAIRPYQDATDRPGTIALWQSVFGYESAHNDPGLSINRKLAVADGLFWLAVDGERVVGSIMAGYDGHRGWLYSLAVLPEQRGRGLGSELVATAERELAARGCVKVNLQIAEGNEAVKAFYETLGFHGEVRVSMGKILHSKNPSLP